ncbi:uncharacterized protein [Elaeis guineensis]|uniref:uncharacterized protein isoform X2 n=1 Tax=Elaeis guineensis var. tenera TaxID=51953 RepID=UPI003C6D3958
MPQSQEQAQKHIENPLENDIMVNTPKQKDQYRTRLCKEKTGYGWSCRRRRRWISDTFTRSLHPSHLRILRHKPNILHCMVSLSGNDKDRDKSKQFWR